MAHEINKKTVLVEERTNEKQKFNQEDLIFALDIGTRTVVGVVGIEENGKFKVLAVEIIEHKNRAMLDGQIHDITLVAEIVSGIKEKLERKIGGKLERVAIAAAGRVLKTYSVKVERALEPNKEATKEMVSSLELEAIQQAQLQLESEQKQEEKIVFYCVGYSIISYYLNGYVISSLLGHKGKSIGAEVLATFLPHVVIDSLYTVMNRVGLEVINLTLEPIAAINVCIPPNLRLLNLALVDIGAGTSDIAITKDGAVIGYAMAPVAGDEITEKIAHHYLIDFNTAESIKLKLNNEDEKNVKFTDVLGMKRQVDKKEIFKVIQESIVHLGEIIAEKILEYNQKAPNAVFCVGGGSQIRGLTEVLSERLGLSLERVVVRGRDMIQSVKFSGKKLAGPEAITPLGIAVNSMQQKEHDFLSVTLNGKKIRLFNSKKLNVADALILVGFDPRQLIGRTGKSVTFEINGEKKTIRGEFGKAAVITVNGEQANMETLLQPSDIIDVTPAVDGKPAKPAIGDVIDLNEKKVVYNKLTIDITHKVTINGNVADSSTFIREGDKVNYSIINAAEDFAGSLEMDVSRYKIIVNGKEVSRDYSLCNGDIIEFIENSINDMSAYEEAVPILEQDYDIDQYEEYMNSKQSDSIKNQDVVVDSMDASEGKIYTKSGRIITVSVNGKSIVIDGNKNDYMFLDVFNSIDFDMTKVKGSVAFRLNGREAGFTDTITHGDVIEITWDQN